MKSQITNHKSQMTNCKNVFDIFAQICRVPRPSKHEEQISKWLQDFAAAHQIECIADEAMNVIMRVPATPGYENHEGVILQAHMDMVAEKDGNVQHDFMRDPIETYVEGEWLKAKGTTLGADDGIGIAMALAAITDPNLPHPAIECLFTVDEETGLTGAMKLQDGMLKHKRLINIDSEDDGQIFIGCAGGIDTLAKMHYEPQILNHKSQIINAIPIRLSVSGLLGGHSGDDINKGRANANQLIVWFLARIWPQTEVQLASINGGNLRNAIAREAEAVIAIPMAYKEQIRIEWNHFVAQMEGVFGEVEKDMRLELETTDMPELFIPADKAYRLVMALCECPHGMIAMSKDIPGLVETSTNLASIKMYEDTSLPCGESRRGVVEINTSQRSSIEASKHHLKWAVEQALSLACDEVTHGDGYPGWAPNPKSELLEVVKKAYTDLFKAEPKVLAIHAGVPREIPVSRYGFYRSADVRRSLPAGTTLYPEHESMLPMVMPDIKIPINGYCVHPQKAVILHPQNSEI